MAQILPEEGPFRADQIGEGDRYELSHGHPIYALPGGSSHAGKNLTGGILLDSDPDVEWAGVDAGVSTDPRQLRAPDVAVGPVPDEDGDDWLKQAPLLALEYTARGQDQGEIEAKIAELLEAETRYIWVVHLTGLPRVDVHTPGQAVKTVDLEGVLEAPGVLRNPVPVKALFDRRTAHQVVLRNLLQREGYEDLDAVRIEGFDEGHSEGLEEGRIDGEAAMLHRLLEAKFGPLPRPVLERLALADEEQLLRWGERLLSAETLEAVVE